MRLAIEAHGLSRRFGDLVAVDSIYLQVPSGSFYGFLGPNGAGKSTTITCLTGLLRPSSGSMTVLGFDPLRDPVALHATGIFLMQSPLRALWMVGIWSVVALGLALPTIRLAERAVARRRENLFLVATEGGS